MDAANDEYRRRARRLRWQLRDRPGDMQRELGKLAAGVSPTGRDVRRAARIDSQGSLLRQVQRLREQNAGATGTHQGMADARVRHAGQAAEVVFMDQVRQRLDGRVLRYSCREELLRLAAELGIGRFEANLLMASVQHQATAGTRNPLRPRRAAPASTITMVSAALVVQSLVLLGLWLILR